MEAYAVQRYTPRTVAVLDEGLVNRLVGRAKGLKAGLDDASKRGSGIFGKLAAAYHGQKAGAEAAKQSDDRAAQVKARARDIAKAGATAAARQAVLGTSKATPQGNVHTTRFVARRGARSAAATKAATKASVDASKRVFQAANASPEGKLNLRRLSLRSRKSDRVPVSADDGVRAQIGSATLRAVRATKPTIPTKSAAAAQAPQQSARAKWLAARAQTQAQTQQPAAAPSRTGIFSGIRRLMPSRGARLATAVQNMKKKKKPAAATGTTGTP